MSLPPVQDNALQRVKDAAQIVDIVGEVVALKRTGINLKGLCPFHAEKTPSFTVNPDRQTFHCFGCGEGGDVFSFLMKYHRMTFPEALRELAGRYHIPLPERDYSSPTDQARSKQRESLFKANERAAAVYHDFLLTAAAAAPARAYLEKRGIPPAIIKAFRLGYAPDSWDFLSRKIAGTDFPPTLAEEAGLIVRKPQGSYYDRFRDRVLCPLFDLTGKVMGFGGRILGDGTPKYLNSPETPIFDKGRTLFGLFQNKDAIRKAGRSLIVEGNFDLLSLAAQGIDHAVAPLGTALTQPQIRILKGYAEQVILFFDGDAAGLKAALRSVPLFLAEQVSARVAVLPPEHDPDTYIRQYGREQLERLLDQAQGLLDFVFEQLMTRHGTTPEGKSRILAELRPLIESSADNPLQHSVLVAHFSERLQLDPGQMLRGFQEAARARSRPAPPPGPSASAGSALAALPTVQRQLLEFLILYPRYLPQFLDHGVEEILVDPAAAAIVTGLREISALPQTGGPEQLLDLLPAGPERAFVSSLLVSAPLLPDDGSEDALTLTAKEKLVWLAAERHKRTSAGLLREIKAAQRAGDTDRLQELMVKKMAMNRAQANRDTDNAN
ncbi:MAG: DNA primase [Deltaproteobacteria bacterium RIFOXYD12_FULL_57_12]|nr:MAG: DNA primase [Deltaproteobacteria bacterium RIFOXYD12_FULL_57_12]